jgi:hypothetical protein
MACTRYGGASFKQTEAILVVVTAALKRCHGDDSRGDKSSLFTIPHFSPPRFCFD